MNKQEIKEIIPVLQAWIDGKTIQYQIPDDTWADVVDAVHPNEYEYRIKPEPREFWINPFNIPKTGGFHVSAGITDTAQPLDNWIHVREVLDDV